MKIFYHGDDADGWSSAAIAAFFNRGNEYITYTSINYSSSKINSKMIEEIGENEQVIITDISFTENNMNILDELMEKTNNIIWIDHHASSVNLVNEYPKYAKINGVIDSKESAALLAYKYFTGASKTEYCPIWVRYISDHDTWTHKHPQSKDFISGLSLLKNRRFPNVPNNIWFQLLDTFNTDKNWYNTKINKLCQDGHVINENLKITNTSLVKRYSFVSNVFGVECLVINSPYKSSDSLSFKYEDYPMVCVYTFDGKDYSYSIYSYNKQVDCSKIAEAYGGGGHKGAAGFTLDWNLFEQAD